ncbi:hypothetical protein AGMMS4952_17170 [Spirochaetia bacterium]|nr:hypothetical protein AGMMS4952_17170 [Spirochaetia bacterium]
MKRMFWKGAIALSLFTVLLFTGCDTGGGGNVVYPESLSSTDVVWEVANLNSSGEKVWLWFKDGTQVIRYFTRDMTTTTHNYSYDKATGKGSITTEGGGWAPGAFSANTAGTALTFSSWGGHGFTAAALKIDDPIAEIPAPSDTAVKTDAVLTGALYRGLAGNGKTVIFKFTSETEVKNLVMSEAATNTYTVSGSAGSFTMGGSSWAPGAFTVINNGNTLHFSDYGGHGAGIKYFSKLDPDEGESSGDVYPESLSSTDVVWEVANLNSSGEKVWLWFKDGTQVIRYFTRDMTTTTHNYSYDNVTGSGSIMTEGGGWAPGTFSANPAGTALTFSSWGGHGFTAAALKIDDPIAAISAPSNTTVKTDATLIGALYRGLAGNGKTVIFKFTSETEVKNLVMSEAATNTYTVSGSAGSFTMGGSSWAPGAFTVINNGNTLHFSDYGGHGAGIKYFSKLE